MKKISFFFYHTANLQSYRDLCKKEVECYIAFAGDSDRQTAYRGARIKKKPGNKLKEKDFTSYPSSKVTISFWAIG